jgi:HTH-type transcriptional regulator / antitoxin HigA
MIKTKQQYRRYLKQVDSLIPLDPHPRTDEGVKLVRLAKLVEDYEKKHFVFGKPEKRRISTARRTKKR